MNLKLLKALVFPLVAVITTCGYSVDNQQSCVRPATTECCAPTPCCDCCKDPCIEEPQLNGAYNAPARVTVRCGWDWYVSTSFIYWQNLAHNTYFGTWDNDVTGHDADSALHAHHQMADYEYKFHPGFKVGIGFNSDMDDWNAFLRYTWFQPGLSHTATRAAADATKLNLYSVNDPEDVHNCIQIHSHWKMKMNVVELELGRSFYVGKNLTFNVNVGPKGYWITSKVNNYNWTSATHYYAMHNSNKSWGLGARTGVDMNWILGQGVYMLANGAYTLAYQHYDLATNGHTHDSDINMFNYHDCKGGVVSIAEAAMGFGWGTYLDNQKWHLDLSAAYEFQLWTDQITDLAYANLQPSSLEGAEHHNVANGSPYNPTNLMIHGLTITARMDF